MKNLSHLPEKFAFKLDELGKRWIRETFGTDYYDTLFGDKYFVYPNFMNYNGFYAGYHIAVALKSDYTEIPTSQLFPPQNIVPTIEKGVMMLVWNNEEEPREKEVVFFNGKHYVCKDIHGGYFRVKNAKPIPQLPEYTIEQLKEIVGHEFKIKQ
jgi:hypothetical protein